MIVGCDLKNNVNVHKVVQIKKTRDVIKHIVDSNVVEMIIREYVFVKQIYMKTTESQIKM